MLNQIKLFSLFLIAAIIPQPVSSQTLPDTELGNVILRPLDVDSVILQYAGHAGIQGGWEGVTDEGDVADSDDPSTYRIYDLQGTPSSVLTDDLLNVPPRKVATNSELTFRTFQQFSTLNNLVDSPVTAYAGGFTRISPFTNDMRNRIILEAESARQFDYTAVVSIEFIKDFTNREFRCDGMVEHVLEQAGVGIYSLAEEPLLLLPRIYADNTDDTVRELGGEPNFFQFSQAGTKDAIVIDGTTGDGVIGSGIKLVEVSAFSPLRTVLSYDLTSIMTDGLKTYSLSINPADIPSGVRTASVQSYDGAGNKAVTVIDVSFLTIALKTDDLQVILDGGALPFDKDKITVEAVELGEFDPNPGSGVDKFVLTQTAGGTRSETKTFTGDPSYQASHVFLNILPGSYEVAAFDRAGNVSTVFFHKSPLVRVFDSLDQEILDGDTKNSQTVRVTGDDFTGAGIDRIVLSGPSSDLKTFSGEASVSVTFPQAGGSLLDGTYTATAFDLVGNNTSVMFTIDNIAPTVRLIDDDFRDVIAHRGHTSLG